jgi:hypothetical protein
VCDETLTGFVPTGDAACATPQLCSTGLGGEVSCDQPICAVGEFRCAGDLLQRCSDGRNSWLDVQACGSPQLCDQSFGALGCRPPVCVAGEPRCVGDTLELCRAGGEGSDPIAECALAGGCDPALGDCRDPCVVGAPRCTGALLEICDDPLTGWQSTPCASAELCNAGARRCDPAECRPGDRRCLGAQPQRCTPGMNGFVDVGAACATPELCDPDDGSCLEPACDAGETVCDGGDTLLTCNADQTGFDSTPCTGLLVTCDSDPPAACRSIL